MDKCAANTGNKFREHLDKTLSIGSTFIYLLHGEKREIMSTPPRNENIRRYKHEIVELLRYSKEEKINFD